MLNVYLSFQNLELIRTIQILCQLVAQGLLSQVQPDFSASSCVSAAEVALRVTGPRPVRRLPGSASNTAAAAPPVGGESDAWRLARTPGRVETPFYEETHLHYLKSIAACTLQLVFPRDRSRAAASVQSLADQCGGGRKHDGVPSKQRRAI